MNLNIHRLLNKGGKSNVRDSWGGVALPCVKCAIWGDFQVIKAYLRNSYVVE